MRRLKKNGSILVFWIEQNLWAIGIITSTVILYDLIFTNWRPFYSNDPDRMNSVLETFCFGIFISSVFYLINDYIPESQIRLLKRSRNKRELRAIRENIRYIYICALPFRFDIEKLSEEEYVKLFMECDLLGIGRGNKANIKECLESHRDKIVRGCEKILASPIKCNSIKDIKYVKYILTSDFVNMSFNPKIFLSEKEYVFQYDDNQGEIGRGIYRLYHHN